jgi:hypothetical protein
MIDHRSKLRHQQNMFNLSTLLYSSFNFISGRSPLKGLTIEWHKRWLFLNVTCKLRQFNIVALIYCLRLFFYRQGIFRAWQIALIIRRLCIFIFKSHPVKFKRIFYLVYKVGVNYFALWFSLKNIGFTWQLI